MNIEKTLIHKGLILDATELKGSPVGILVPNTTTHLQGSSAVLTGHSEDTIKQVV